MVNLDYAEDSSADTDMNLIMDEQGRLVEIQGTAESKPFSRAELAAMLDRRHPGHPGGPARGPGQTPGRIPNRTDPPAGARRKGGTMNETHRDDPIVLASNNPGKVREINALLEAAHIQVIPQRAFGVPEVEETGLTFVENAILKARNAARHSGLAAIADDSGIEVDVLNGAPGIYSARFAGVGASDQANLDRLLEVLQDVPQEARSARFQCLMVYMRHGEDPTPLICQGTWEGRILPALRGENGFGYDPVFYVPGEDCSSAELPAATKNRLSHRGQALRALVRHLGGAD